MKPIEINKKQTLTNEEKETFFQHLENNSDFFNEALEAILTLVISDPLLTFQVSDLIEMDYRNLYLAMIRKQEPVQNIDLPSCCQTPKN